MSFKQYTVVRLLQTHEGPGSFSQGVVRCVPAGTQGTILEVYGKGAAFEVEFTVRPATFDGDVLLDPGELHHLTLEPHQIEPA